MTRPAALRAAARPRAAADLEG